MRVRSGITLCVFIALTAACAPAFSGEQAAAPERCKNVRAAYLDAEERWSEVNAEVGLLRQDMASLRNLRWDIKVTVAVLKDALKIQQDGPLSDVQRMTLNSRIPSRLGRIEEDDTFALLFPESKPLPLSKAVQELEKCLPRIEEKITRTEGTLLAKEQESHSLSEEVAGLERKTLQECSSAGLPTPWEEGMHRRADEDIYERLVEREALRQREVEQRRESDLDALILESYRSRRHRPLFGFPSDPYYDAYPRRRTGGLLIRLYGDKGRTCMRCYPFSSPWEKRWIGEELERAVDHHEFIPCAGRLEGFETIRIFHDIERCYRSLY